MHARLGDRTLVVEPEQLVIIPAGTPHWNWNEGTEDEVHFEPIVPPPPPGEPLVTPVSETNGGSLSIEPVRALDHTRFDPALFQVVLTDRSTGLETQHTLVTIPAGMPHRNANSGSEAEFHLNLRVPEPEGTEVQWDLPITIGGK